MLCTLLCLSIFGLSEASDRPAFHQGGYAGALSSAAQLKEEHAQLENSNEKLKNVLQEISDILEDYSGGDTTTVSTVTNLEDHLEDHLGDNEDVEPIDESDDPTTTTTTKAIEKAITELDDPQQKVRATGNLEEPTNLEQVETQTTTTTLLETPGNGGVPDTTTTTPLETFGGTEELTNNLGTTTTTTPLETFGTEELSNNLEQQVGTTTTTPETPVGDVATTTTTHVSDADLSAQQGYDNNQGVIPDTTTTTTPHQTSATTTTTTDEDDDDQDEQEIDQDEVDLDGVNIDDEEQLDDLIMDDEDDDTTTTTTTDANDPIHDPTTTTTTHDNQPSFTPLEEQVLKYEEYGHKNDKPTQEAQEYHVASKNVHRILPGDKRDNKHDKLDPMENKLQPILNSESYLASQGKESHGMYTSDSTGYYASADTYCSGPTGDVNCEWPTKVADWFTDVGHSTCYGVQHKDQTLTVMSCHKDIFKGDDTSRWSCDNVISDGNTYDCNEKILMDYAVWDDQVDDDEIRKKLRPIQVNFNHRVPWKDPETGQEDITLDKVTVYWFPLPMVHTRFVHLNNNRHQVFIDDVQPNGGRNVCPDLVYTGVMKVMHCARKESHKDWNECQEQKQDVTPNPEVPQFQVIGYINDYTDVLEMRNTCGCFFQAVNMVGKKYFEANPNFKFMLKTKSMDATNGAGETNELYDGVVGLEAGGTAKTLWNSLSTLNQEQEGSEQIYKNKITEYMTKFKVDDYYVRGIEGGFSDEEIRKFCGNPNDLPKNNEISKHYELGSPGSGSGWFEWFLKLFRVGNLDDQLVFYITDGTKKGK